jgi:maltose O-acetyltransferase
VSSLRERLKTSGGEYLQQLASYLISLPIVPIQLRPFLMRLNGIVVGKKPHIGPFLSYKKTGITLGDYVVIGQSVFLDATGTIDIGDRVHVGPFTKLVSATHTIMPSVYRRDRDELVAEPIVIERGSWIGTGATILAGVTVGEGCVIGAGSLVTRSCDANGLYVGVPARRVKDLPVQ